MHTVNNKSDNVEKVSLTEVPVLFLIKVPSRRYLTMSKSRNFYHGDEVHVNKQEVMFNVARTRSSARESGLSSPFHVLTPRPSA
jgi:hypothetical protein